MASWQFSFPPSRSCLWDPSPTGPSTELNITRNSWVCVQVSLAAVQLAVRHARQTPCKQLDCLLIGSAWITQGEGVVVDVDRFDPGRPEKQGSGVVPTALIPGDIAIPCQVMADTRSSSLTHNLVTLQKAMDELCATLTRPPAPLDPTALLSMRIQCSCFEDGSLHVHCGCVSPRLPCTASPLHPLPIVQTALARNLTGPLPLSTLQGRAKHGYLTMETTRKLVLLLHSDPKTSTLPLVGVWISGIISEYHPLVWTACVSYCHSAMLGERVWGEEGGFLLVVYREGATQPTFWECRVELRGEETSLEWELSCAETSLQLSSSERLVPLQLLPVQQSSALHTLLQAASHSHTPCDTPLPSPHPTPTQIPRLNSDTELSCLSLLEESPTHPSPSTTHPTHPPPSTSHFTCPPPSTTHPTHPPLSTSHLTCPPTADKSNHSSLTDRQTTPVHASSHPSTIGSDVKVFPEKQSAMEQLLWRQEQQLRALQEQVNDLLKNQSPALHSPPSSHPTPSSRPTPSSHPTLSSHPTPTLDASTTTGESLIYEGTSSHLPTPTSTIHSTTSHSSTHPSSHLPTPTSTIHSTTSHSSTHPSSHLPTPTSTIHSTTSHSSTHPSSHLPTPTSTIHSTTSHSSTRASSHLPTSHLPTSDSPTSHMCSECYSVGELSIQTGVSLLSTPTTDLHLDLHSYAAQSTCSPPSPSPPPSPTNLGEGNVSLLFRDQQRFYDNMMLQVNELLHPPSEHPPISSPSPSCSPTTSSSFLPTASPSSILPTTSPSSLLPATSTSSFLPTSSSILLEHCGNVSMLPVPRIMCGGVCGSVTELSEGTTLDEQVQLADLIALKYLNKGEDTSAGGATVWSAGNHTLTHMSIATKQYLLRHQLMDNGKGGGNVLDIGRLKTLPKLL